MALLQSPGDLHCASPNGTCHKFYMMSSPVTEPSSNRGSASSHGPSGRTACTSARTFSAEPFPALGPASGFDTPGVWVEVISSKLEYAASRTQRDLPDAKLAFFVVESARVDNMSFTLGDISACPRPRDP